MFGRFRRGNEVVAFAMSGGGSRGACQVGMVRALVDAGIHPQLLTGTSAGAVNATFLAMYPGRLDNLEAIWMRLRTKDVFPGGRVRTMTNYIRHGHIHDSSAWEEFLRSQAGDARFEDTLIPCAVVAVRLSDGARVVFESGELVPAIMASTAIPGVFPPYRIGEELYVDGGVLEYMPLLTAVERGAGTIYALDCSYYGPGSDFSGSIVDRSSRISASGHVQRAVALASAGGNKVYHLRPVLPDFDDSRNFGYTRHLIDAGYAHARQYLAGHALSRSASIPQVADHPAV